MSETQAAKPEVKMVAVMNQGVAPHSTSVGMLRPGQSVEVPEAEAKKLCAYRDIVLASSVVPSIGKAETLQAENAVLRGKIADMEKQLGESTGKVTDLSGRLKAFLEADKKDLPALQKEHADAVPAEGDAAAQ